MWGSSARPNEGYPDIGIPWHCFFGLKDVKDVFQWFWFHDISSFLENTCLLRSNRLCFIGSAHLLFSWVSSHQTPNVAFGAKKKSTKNILISFLRHMKLGYPDMFPIKPDFDGFSIWNWSISAPVSALTSPSCPKKLRWWFRGGFVYPQEICRKNILQMMTNDL